MKFQWNSFLFIQLPLEPGNLFLRLFLLFIIFSFDFNFIPLMTRILILYWKRVDGLRINGILESLSFYGTRSGFVFRFFFVGHDRLYCSMEKNRFINMSIRVNGNYSLEGWINFDVFHSEMSGLPKGHWTIILRNFSLANLRPRK